MAGLSLAAARADNFYYPPEFDPVKHKSLDKFNGQHPLRARAAKLDQGILVIRFEVPFNILCEKCGEHIAKGERFNAEKKAIGNYHSTKVLQFSMAHHCGCKITIQTDPKNAEYLVVEGAKKKAETYSAADAEVIELPDDEEKARRAADPLYRLEYQQGAKATAMSNQERLACLQDMADERSADPFALNKALRAQLRASKRRDAALDGERQRLGLKEGVRLLPAVDSDGLAASLAFRGSHGHAQAQHSADERRKAIMAQSIFSSSGRGSSKSGGGGGGSGSSKDSIHHRSGGGGGGAAVAVAAAATGGSKHHRLAGGALKASGLPPKAPAPLAAAGAGRGGGVGGAGGGGGGRASGSSQGLGVVKPALKYKAAELARRRKAPGGVGLSLTADLL